MCGWCLRLEMKMKPPLSYTQQTNPPCDDTRTQPHREGALPGGVQGLRPPRGLPRLRLPGALCLASLWFAVSLERGDFVSGGTPTPVSIYLVIHPCIHALFNHQPKKTPHHTTKQQAHDFRVDALEPLRVWFTTRKAGTHKGPLPMYGQVRLRS